jgi:hypothetical protein
VPLVGDLFAARSRCWQNRLSHTERLRGHLGNANDACFFVVCYSLVRPVACCPRRVTSICYKHSHAADDQPRRRSCKWSFRRSDRSSGPTALRIGCHFSNAVCWPAAHGLDRRAGRSALDPVCVLLILFAFVFLRSVLLECCWSCYSASCGTLTPHVILLTSPCRPSMPLHGDSLLLPPTAPLMCTRCQRLENEWCPQKMRT